ncbi:MAG: hypothetical protein A2162_02925 [Deltaproteobacteria bacterium RBG_13_52_11b]|nr:MAG: hypothetical protein A2162_02925 [Deltaproteobacteria bacterium RBG_13_52_11b]
MKRSFFGWLVILTLSLVWIVTLAKCGKEESALSSAPDFTLKSLDNHEITLSTFRGSVVLLDFWATWCKPCRESIPHLIHLHKTHKKDGLVVLGMNVDRGDPEPVRRFIASMEVPYPNVAVSPEVEKDYGIKSLPTTVFIDKEGRIREKIVGFNAQTAKRLTERVVELTSESSPAKVPQDLSSKDR